MGDGFLDVFRARDVSTGGLGVLVPHDFEGCNIEASVDLLLKLPGAKVFLVKATIRHAGAAGRRHYFGVEFTSVPAEGLRQIEAYVAQRLREGGAA